MPQFCPCDMILCFVVAESTLSDAPARGDILLMVETACRRVDDAVSQLRMLRVPGCFTVFYDETRFCRGVTPALPAPCPCRLLPALRLRSSGWSITARLASPRSTMLP